jgi:hypothetical protein
LAGFLAQPRPPGRWCEKIDIDFRFFFKEMGVMCSVNKRVAFQASELSIVQAVVSKFFKNRSDLSVIVLIKMAFWFLDKFNRNSKISNHITTAVFKINEKKKMETFSRR